MDQRLYDPPHRRSAFILPTILLATACASWIATASWRGLGSRSMGIDAAILVAADQNVPQSRRAAAAATLRREATRAIVTLRALSSDSGAAGDEARASLLHLHAATESR